MLSSLNFRHNVQAVGSRTFRNKPAPGPDYIKKFYDITRPITTAYGTYKSLRGLLDGIKYAMELRDPGPSVYDHNWFFICYNKQFNRYLGYSHLQLDLHIQHVVVRLIQSLQFRTLLG